MIGIAGLFQRADQRWRRFKTRGDRHRSGGVLAGRYYDIRAKGCDLGADAVAKAKSYSDGQ